MHLITRIYDNHPIAFSDDGFFNATEAAAVFGKRPVEWLRLDSTKEYINAIIDFKNEKTFEQSAYKHFAQTEIVVLTESDLIKTVRGGSNPGTWIRQELAVLFARWLNPKFAVWCDYQINLLLTDRVHEVVQNMEMLKREFEKKEAGLKQAVEKKEAYLDDRINTLVHDRLKSKSLSTNYVLMEKHASHVEQRNLALEDQVSILMLEHEVGASDASNDQLAEVRAWASEQLANMQKGRWYSTTRH